IDKTNLVRHLQCAAVVDQSRIELACSSEHISQVIHFLCKESGVFQRRKNTIRFVYIVEGLIKLGKILVNASDVIVAKRDSFLLIIFLKYRKCTLYPRHSGFIVSLIF